MHPQRIKPAQGQESVWDYPRPPAIEQFKGSIEIVYEGTSILKCTEAYRVLETSHPPTYYLPVSQFLDGVVIPVHGSSFCEWKGQASYYNLTMNGRVADRCAWGYDNPSPRFSALKGHISVYASKVDECFVNGERVQSQEGDFYGGWITSNIVGPFKGAPGTWGW